MRSQASSATPARDLDVTQDLRRPPQMPDLPITVRLSPLDNIVVARIDILPNTELAGEVVRTAQRVPAGHKVAIRPIAKGEPCASTARSSASRRPTSAPASTCTCTTCAMGDFERDYAFGADVRSRPAAPSRARDLPWATVRADGRSPRATTSASSPRVNCSATRRAVIAEHFRARRAGASIPNVDGVVAAHPRHRLRHGRRRARACDLLRRTLAGYAAPPELRGGAHRRPGLRGRTRSPA